MITAATCHLFYKFYSRFQISSTGNILFFVAHYADMNLGIIQIRIRYLWRRAILLVI